MTSLSTSQWSPGAGLRAWTVTPVPPLAPMARDDNRPLNEYPFLEDCNCYQASKALAACYPELELRSGVVYFQGDRNSLRAPAC